MLEAESDVTVGADPDKRAVIVRVHESGGQRRWMDCLLSPTEADTVSTWLRTAAAHVRAGSRRELRLERLESLKCEVSVEAGSTSFVTLMISEPKGTFRRFLGVPLPPEVAEQTAGWLEGAASHMKAQASGEIDLRTVFQRGPVGDA